MAEMVSRMCEFKPDEISNIVKLVKKLQMAKQAEIVEESTENQIKTLERLKEKIQSGGSPDQIFNLLDKDQSGDLDFDEF